MAEPNVAVRELEPCPEGMRSPREDAPASFLDLIPRELLENVFKFFSRLRQAPNWEAHVPLEDIIGLSRVSGGLGRLFRTQFRMLCVSKTRYCYDENLYYGWKLRAEPHLWTNNIDVARQYVSSGGGESLRTLVVGIGMYVGRSANARLVDDFRKYCPHITSLSIDETRSTWVDRFAGRLETLEVASRYRTVLDIRPTPALRELTLDTGSNYFDLAYSRCVIGNLETLIISGGTIPFGQYNDIRRFCPHLNCISMQGRTQQESIQVSRFIASYAGQLKYAYLRDMDEAQIAHVAAACPNARFHLQDNRNGLSVAALSVLGDRLGEVTMSGFYIQEADNPAWRKAWDKCTTLRKLTISNCKLQDVEAVFATPKDHLEVLSIDMQMAMRAESMKKLMEICAKGTKCVRKLVYGGQPFPCDAGVVFFEKNHRSLTSITIGEKRTALDSRSRGLLESLLKLPALEELNLDWYIPQSTVRLLEKRGVHCNRRIFAWQ